MAEGNKEQKDELKSDIFPELTMEEEPELDGGIPNDGHRSLSQMEQEGVGQTDVRAIVNKLLPQFADSEIDEIDIMARAIMVSRVSPDMFYEAMHLTIISILERHAYDGIDNDKPLIDVMTVINIIFSVYSMALEGKVRVVLVELAGAAKETEEAEKIANKLGLG